MTSNDPVIKKDLARAERLNIPVNIIYPPNYPEQPAILLEELISPNDALAALEQLSDAAISAQASGSKGNVQANLTND